MDLAAERKLNGSVSAELKLMDSAAERKLDGFSFS